MHYIPANWQADLDAPENSTEPAENPAIPLYVLCGVVGLLLGADVLLEWLNVPAWNAYRTPFGIRLALLAAVVGGARIFYQTLEGLLFENRIGADLALTIATFSAILLGEQSVAALVVFIAICGESLEGYVGGRAQHAIRGLLRLRPNTAHVIRDGQELDLPLHAVRVGDSLLVRPGERLPVDGTVLSGRSTVDQSALTGESIPADKQPGDAVFTGTLNQLGALTILTERIGRDTTFGQIVEHVTLATTRKTRLERTADRLARYFLPAVLLAAGLTLLSWRVSAGTWRAGWLPALSVLVVACPCPLILATPSAVMAALAWLARAGIVIKGSAALERLAQVDTLVFDKTGTLTTGELRLGELFSIPELASHDLLKLAATAEQASEHLLARLIVREARAQGWLLPLTGETQVHPGAGVTAHIPVPDLMSICPALPVTENWGTNSDPAVQDAVAVHVGNRRFLETLGLTLPPNLEGWLQALDDTGQTPLCVAIDQTVVGVIGVRDSVRPEARQVVQQLREDGIRQVALLTGDRRSPAQRVLHEVGPLEHVIAEMLPLGKAKWIEEQQQAGRRVAMVGDGINDAPALAAANVGIALGSVGGQIAAEAGDIVCLGPPLTVLPGLLRLSRALVQNIRQSIYWFAFGMNGVGVLLAAIGWLSPVWAAVFHEVASLAVMLNALRLLWFERWEATRLGRACQSCANVLEWTAEAAAPSRLAVGLVRHAGLLVRLSLAALGIWWLTTNLVWLSPDERALVTRFGKQVAVLPAGVYWRWPVPLERVYRQPVERWRTLQIGFRSEGANETSEAIYQPAIEWQADHKLAGFQAVSDESNFLTGEELPIELTAEVLYAVRDLRQFQFGVADMEPVLRATSEGVLRRAVARRTIETLLTVDRADLEAEAVQEIQRLADGYNLGIEILGLNLLDMHPPVMVVPDYRRVADALEEQERLLNEAEVTVARELISAAGERGVAWLQDNAAEAVNGDQRHQIAPWKLTDELWQKLLQNAGDQPAVLSGQAAADLLAAQQKRTEQIAAAQGETVRLEALADVALESPRLTRLHLYWSVLEESLAAARLTIVDPLATNRRQLWLGTEPAPAPVPVTEPPVLFPPPEEDGT